MRSCAEIARVPPRMRAAMKKEAFRISTAGDATTLIRFSRPQSHRGTGGTGRNHDGREDREGFETCLAQRRESYVLRGPSWLKADYRLSIGTGGISSAGVNPNTAP